MAKARKRVTIKNPVASGRDLRVTGFTLSGTTVLLATLTPGQRRSFVQQRVIVESLPPQVVLDHVA